MPAPTSSNLPTRNGSSEIQVACPPCSTNASSRAYSSSSRPEPWHVACEEPSLDDGSYFNPAPRAIFENPVQFAANAFFGDFLQLARHPDSHRSVIELLCPSYRSAREDSLVSLTASAVILAAIGNTHRRRFFYKLSFSIFGRALKMTKASHRGPNGKSQR